MSETRLAITLRRSPIGREKSQGATARALGLRRLNATVIQPDNPQIRGMIFKIQHLVEVRPVEVEVEPTAAAEAPAAVETPAEEAPKPARKPRARKTEEVAEDEATPKPARKRAAKKAETAEEPKEETE